MWIRSHTIMLLGIAASCGVAQAAKPLLDLTFPPRPAAPAPFAPKSDAPQPRTKPLHNLMKPRPCAIPLLEAEVPKDVDYAIRKHKPPPQEFPIRQAQPPAPPCDSARR
jgi:hypothetical protein